MTANRNGQKRGRRKFRPLRRALLLLMAGVLAFGVFRTASWAYSRAFGEKVQLSRATEVAQSPLFRGPGVLLREELVVVAPRPGTVNAMVATAADVAAGDEIMEIVDRDRLAEIERLISEEEAKRGGPGQDPVANLSNAENALRLGTETIRNMSQSYAGLLRQGRTAEAATLFEEIARASEQRDRQQGVYEQALGVTDELGSRYNELLEQRETAIHKIVAPVGGLVSWVVDELSSSAKPAMAPDKIASLLNVRKPGVLPLTSGVTVAAGSSLCAIVDPASITLVVSMQDELWSRDEPINLRVNGQEMDVDLWSQAPASDGVSLYFFRFMSISSELVSSRFVDVEIWPVRETAFSVPITSLTQNDGAPAVFALADDGAVIAVAVHVVETTGSSAIVTGLDQSLWVIANPDLVTVGDVLPRPRGN